MPARAIIHVDDKMQSGYSCALVAGQGKDFSPDFQPHYSPREMLE